MTTETRYISFDGAIFYSEKECRDYEETHMFAGLDKVVFLDINFEPLVREEYTLDGFIRNTWAIKVSTVKEAERVWDLLKQYDNDEFIIDYEKNPLIGKDGILEERVLIFDGDVWRTIPDYLSSTFNLLQKVGCDPLTLAAYFQDYCGVNKNAE